MDTESGYRINKATGAFLFGTAVAIDAGQIALEWILVGGSGGLLLPLSTIINACIDVAVNFSYWFWFKLYDVSFYSAKNAIPALGTLVMEVIPGFDQIPFFTLDIAFVLGITYLEDNAAIAARAKQNSAPGSKIVRKARINGGREQENRDFTPRRSNRSNES
jgi:hypothetical protein